MPLLALLVLLVACSSSLADHVKPGGLGTATLCHGGGLIAQPGTLALAGTAIIGLVGYSLRRRM